jgi:hypothetical protein
MLNRYKSGIFIAKHIGEPIIVEIYKIATNFVYFTLSNIIVKFQINFLVYFSFYWIATIKHTRVKILIQHCYFYRHFRDKFFGLAYWPAFLIFSWIKLIKNFLIAIISFKSEKFSFFCVEAAIYIYTKVFRQTHKSTI